MKFRSTFNEEVLTNPTKEFAYYLGYFWADGYTSRRGSTVNLQIVEEDGKDIIEVIKTFSNPSLVITKAHIGKDGCNRKSRIDIAISNKSLKEFMFLHDFKTKSFGNFSSIISFLTEDLQKYFIRGYFDGDGSIYSPIGKKTINQLIFASSYDQDWNFLVNYFSKFDIIFSIVRTIKLKSKSSIIRTTSKKECQSFYNIFYKSYKEDKIGLNRKYEKFENVMLPYKRFCANNPKRM